MMGIIEKIRGRFVPLHLSLSFMVAWHCPSRAWAQDIGAMMKNEAVRGVVFAVARVNRAMRDSAAHPKDLERRENARHAISLLPPAMLALAREYQEHWDRLDPNEFPTLQAMIGNYIAAAAADDYRHFLSHPDKRYIPRLGAAFPRKVLTETYALKVRPKYWKASALVFLVEKAFLETAHAEDDGGKGQAGQIVAGILMGVAAIIAAIAPMVVANIQAKADVKIAEINAETQKTLTTITSNTSKYLADGQKEIALTQSNIAQQISQQNNAGVTERLQMQLAELRSARQDAQQAEKERRDIDNAYNQQRIELAQKQADDNLKLAKATLNAQLSQAGLSQGFSNSTNSGDRLGVSRDGVAGGGTSGALASAAGAAAGGGGGGTGQGFLSPSGRETSSPGLVASMTSQLGGGQDGASARPGGQRGFTSDEEASKASFADALSKAQASATGDALSKAPVSSDVLTRGVMAEASRPSTPAATLLRAVSQPSAPSPGSLQLAEDEQEDDATPDAKRARQKGAAARGIRGKTYAAYDGVVSVGRGFSRRGPTNAIVGGSTNSQHMVETAPTRTVASTSLQPRSAVLAAGGSARGIRNVTAHVDPPAGAGAGSSSDSSHSSGDSGGHSPFKFPEGFSFPGFSSGP